MNPIWAIILGVLQGFTEFLPVSSSGHLVIVQSLIPGFNQPGVLFDVVLHAGTLAAIVYYFRETIVKINRNYILLLVIGSVPAAVFGFIFQAEIESFFGNLKIVGVALLVTALFNFVTDTIKKGRKIESNSNFSLERRNALLIGIAQALAIIPGISRSGATIFAGTKVGKSRREAAEFSFLLSVPAVLGANVLQFATHGTDNNLEMNIFAAGFIASLVSGYIAIKLVLKMLLAKRFKIFAYYAFIVGLISIFIL